MKKNEVKKNNKGFSLVELIVVIAIMAVLVGVLAPQFIKYVNNSKVATDVKNGQEIAAAISTDLADGTISSKVSTATEITSSNKPSAIANLPAVKYTTSGDKKWYFTCDPDTGSVEVYCSGTAATNKVYPEDGYTASRKK
ncbi:MAG: type II secretion system protein [Eubacterium sp.]|nr:type II secretion system protein [Eubacterium sp.]